MGKHGVFMALLHTLCFLASHSTAPSLTFLSVGGLSVASFNKTVFSTEKNWS